jgi:hypothetical protein
LERRFRSSYRIAFAEVDAAILPAQQRIKTKDKSPRQEFFGFFKGVLGTAHKNITKKKERETITKLSG